jgi:hypothetical protein
MEYRLVTDTAARYKHAPVASHEMVDHSKYEWKRGDVYLLQLIDQLVPRKDCEFYYATD